MFDLLIRNAQVLDGTGAPAYLADVAVKDGKIAAVGKLSGEAAETADAAGLTLAPGFIDVHGHSDFFMPLDPARASKLLQGVTTELCGQCGLGPAPVTEQNYPVYHKYLSQQGIPMYPDDRTFTSFSAYLSRMEQTPAGINLAYFIPHGTVRLAVMGFSHDAPDDRQLAQMRELVEDAMQAGALGLSTGLAYAPGRFAATDELAALTEPVGRYGGVYTSHLRDQGDQLEQSVQEAIDIARRGGARVNVSHHKAVGEQNFGKVRKTTQMLHEARIPATHDVYPYAASSTMLISTLPMAFAQLEPQALLQALADPGELARLASLLLQGGSGDAAEACGLDRLLIANATKTPEAAGKTIRQIAQARGVSPFEAYAALLRENELGVQYIKFGMSESDVSYLMADELCMFGSDALYVPGMKVTHPRSIGTFPCVLRRAVREEQSISLPEAVRKGERRERLRRDVRGGGRETRLEGVVGGRLRRRRLGRRERGGVGVQMAQRPSLRLVIAARRRLDGVEDVDDVSREAARGEGAHVSVRLRRVGLHQVVEEARHHLGMRLHTRRARDVVRVV